MGLSEMLDSVPQLNRANLVSALKAVLKHHPCADTTGEIYCTRRVSGNAYETCATFDRDSDWDDHIRSVINEHLGSTR